MKALGPVLAWAVLAASPAGAQTAPTFPASDREAAAMRQGFEGILRKLERAARMPAGGVLLEYLHDAGGVDFSCAHGPVEGLSPAITASCGGEGVITLAGRPAYALLASGPRGEDRLAFILAHELVHAKQRHSDAREAKLDLLHQQWVDRRLAILREMRGQFPDEVERMERGWSADDHWWQWFFRDLYGRDLAHEPPPPDAFLRADQRVAQWVQRDFDLFVSGQEHQADVDGCKIMACARYDPMEAASAVLPLGHILWWETGTKADPRGYGTFAARSRHLFTEAMGGACACENPLPPDEPASTRRGSRRRS